MQTEPLTHNMIYALRTEAGAAGDLVIGHACGVAIGDEDPVTTADAWEERYGGGGHSRDERAGVLAIDSPAVARRVCAVAINSARGMDDSRPFVRVVP
jgi:hypothetical protein